MKKLLLIAAACLATAVSAQQPSTVLGGVLMPSNARGFFVASFYANDDKGDVVVCAWGTRRKFPFDSCIDNADKDVPAVPMAQSVPDGKTYVGFRVVVSPRGDREIEIYFR